MNPLYFGDSFDIIKRFFCEALKCLGYEIYIDPMYTAAMNEHEHTFYSFIGARHVSEFIPNPKPSALFIDPDTGINEIGGKRHVSFATIAAKATVHDVVFAFDQSFSRNVMAKESMKQKIKVMNARGCSAFFYDSHARFIFVARDGCRLVEIKKYLSDVGLPSSRIIENGT